MVYLDLDPVALDDPHVPAHNEEREAINALQNDIVGKIDRPSSPTLGSLLRWNGDDYVPTVMRLFEGVVQPEGNIAAPVGSRYVDLLATDGTPEWYKASGSGLTGWVPLLSSLPWTNISPGSGWTHYAGNPGQISMLNGVIYMRGAMTHVSGTGYVVGTITAPFRPPISLNGHVRSDAGAAPYQFAISSTGNVIVSSTVGMKTVYLESTTVVPFRK